VESVSARLRWLEPAELSVAALLGLVAAALQVRFVSNVGALWRDEANSVHLASMPTVGDILRLLEFDSFPLLHIVLLRGWISIFGNSDMGLRMLGLLLGLAILLALFVTARATGARFPLLSLALLGSIPIVMSYAD
jgi:mannosyltransferase